MSNRLKSPNNTLKRIGLGYKSDKEEFEWGLNTALWGEVGNAWDSLWLLTFNKVPKPNQALTTRINKPVTVLTRVSKPAKPLYTRI